MLDIQYDAICTVIDRAKNDHRSLDTDEYAADIGNILEPETRIAYLTRLWEESTGDTASDYALSEDDWSLGLGDEEAAELVQLIDIQKELEA